MGSKTTLLMQFIKNNILVLVVKSKENKSINNFAGIVFVSYFSDCLVIGARKLSVNDDERRGTFMVNCICHVDAASFKKVGGPLLNLGTL